MYIGKCPLPHGFLTTSSQFASISLSLSGFMYSMAAFGPVLGFLLGAYLLSFHMDAFSGNVISIGKLTISAVALRYNVIYSFDRSDIGQVGGDVVGWVFAVWPSAHHCGHSILLLSQGKLIKNVHAIRHQTNFVITSFSH